MKRVVCFFVVLMLVTGGLFAKGQGDFPARNIEVFVGYGAGGSTDLAARALAEVANADLPKGVNLIVSNIAGDAGIIAFNRFMQAKPDGYTLISANIDMVLNYWLGRTQYGMDDWIPVGQSIWDSFVLLTGNSPNYKDFKEFIEYARANPGQVTMGHAGMGGSTHSFARAIEKQFGITFKYIPYGSSADCAVAIVSGDIEATVSQVAPAVSHVNAGTIRILVTLARQRSSFWPNVPIAKEIFPDFDPQFIAWVFFSVPKGTPPETVKYLRDLFDKARAKPEYAKLVGNLGQEVGPLNSATYAAFVKEQYDLYEQFK